MSTDLTHYTYGKEHADIETVMRFHAVKRWHMIDTTRQQTLAEHSANVALLAYGIAVNAPGMFFGPALALAGIALLHDIPEVFTGDIPSHTKQYISGVDELEKQVTPSMFTVDGVTPDEKRLIKMCDLADGIRFIRLHGVDVTARHAREQLEEKLTVHREAIRADVPGGWPPEIETHVAKWIYFYAYEYS